MPSEPQLLGVCSGRPASIESFRADSTSKEAKVATFIVLFNWTEQGIKSYKDSPKRVDQANEAWQDLGVHVKETYWTIGPYDVVGIVESPDSEALAAALLRLGAAGNVRTTTMRALDRAEAEAVIARAG
jgi:uncharacterized protein with GYD domain